MLHRIIRLVCALAAIEVSAAELEFNFSQYPVNESPPGFRSALSGEGKPGEWKIIEDEVPPTLERLTASSPELTKRRVLAQISTDPTDERFPLFIYEGESFGDFTLTTRFKNVRGVIEQMAGLAFRIQDEKNYYYVRASSLGNTFRFFKLVNGTRSPPIGPEVEIPKGVWHSLTVECQGNRIRCLLNGKELFPALTDNTFTVGKIGFWTKSDSSAYFVDTKVTYTPRETLAKVLVKEMMQKYPRLLGLRIYALEKGQPAPRVIASKEEKEVGNRGEKVERDVMANDSIYYGKTLHTATVTLPLHDRNGETVAAVYLSMPSFFGQTEQNAVARALPIVKEMENRVRNARDLIQ